MKIEGNKLTPGEGKKLTNGSVYSNLVYLGIHDSPDNWREVDADAPEDEETEADKAEAYDILTGVSE